MYQYANRKKSGAAGGIELQFETRSGVFFPTDTSSVLIAGCELVVKEPFKTLDIGCGCGVVGLTLAKMDLVRTPLCASDLSPAAVELAGINAASLGVKIDARCGSLYEPWRGEKFDLIVDDVAGISDDIAAVSGWYPEGVSCDAGRDGVRWVNQVVENAPQHLGSGGRLIFPVLSLSRMASTLECARSVFSQVELVLKRDWFVPEEILKHESLFKLLMADGAISCEHKFGRWLWTTYVYSAT
ncbi:MAG: methyltransferase domain-containing protein [Betaproteobacteria bacterium]|nr:methyltransferase domain-containing protein [Betaproteobacteria bacterium]